MAELYRRNVRIQSKPNDTLGYMVSITDAESGEIIPGVFKAVVTLDANEVNQVEMSYYETQKNGAPVVGSDHEPIIHTELVACAELDTTALERPKMDLGDGMSVNAWPNRTIGESYCRVHLFGKGNHMHMTPDQALALLAWLKVSEADLKTAAQHHNRPLRRSIPPAEGME